MTVSSSLSTQTFNCDGSTTVFTCPFRVLEASELVGYLITVATNESVALVNGTDFAVTGVGSSNAIATTTLTYSSAYQVNFRRRTRRLQSTDYRDNDPFPAESHENALDRLTHIAQENDTSIGRALLVPEPETGATLPAASVRAERLLGFDSAGAMVAVAPTFGSAAALALDLTSSSTDTRGAGQIGFNPTLSYAISTIGAAFRDMPWCPSDYPWLAACDDTTDDTVAVQACIDAAFAAGKGGVRIPAMTRIAGTLQGRSGVTVFGDDSTAEYYVGSPYSTIHGAGFHKHATDSSGPIFALETSGALRGLYLLHEKVGGATTGIVRMGGAATSDVCYYAAIRDCRIYGAATTDVTGATTCYGVYFPESDLGTSKQRYFNHINDVHVTNCDVGFRLSGQSNANNFSNITTRQCYWHVEINGGSSEAVENLFNGINLHNIGILPTTPSVVFVLKNSAKFNVFSGFATECNGATWSVDDTCSYNKFYGTTNETTSSILPVRTAAGALTYNDFIEYTARVNVVQQSEMLLPNLNTGQRFFQGLGNKVSLFRTVSGTLPQCNGGAFPQALVAADADSRVIVQFDSTAYSKAIHPALFCKLKVFASAPAAAGTSIAECEFMYRPTSTGSAAGVLSVIRATVKGAAIAGLHFISGKTGSTEFRIGIVGGTATASAMNFIAVSMEIEGLSYDANSLDMSKFANMGFVSTAATANDVTDAVSLLAVADTVI